MANAHILVAEDNLVNQKVVQGMLKSLGYSSDVVGNGADAIEALSKGGYDLVLMDCQMPVMDGYLATEKIRALESAGELAVVPVVALTANAMESDRQRCMDSGMDDFLAKPIRLDDLGNTIEQWLANKKAG